MRFDSTVITPTIVQPSAPPVPSTWTTAVQPTERLEPRTDVRQSMGGGARDRVPLCGVLIDRVGLPQAASRLETYLAIEQLHQVVTVNLDFLRLARVDPIFRETINEAALAVADGMPLVWASRIAGQGLPERVTGIELVDACCRLSASTGKAVFMLGGRPGIAEEAARTVERRYPGAVVAGTYSPPFGAVAPHDDREIVDRINASGARILLVALGAPRQDNWIRAHHDELEVSVALGVGCTLDILAGVFPRAPHRMQRMGLEWLHRFRLEPARLGRRYFIDDIPMFARLMAESARVSRGGPRWH
jgi:N-acetylglucosaminyldiphosphoundecaprenol N-acetyl-beta-D-mannosaminyltransferase